MGVTLFEVRYKLNHYAYLEKGFVTLPDEQYILNHLNWNSNVNQEYMKKNPVVYPWYWEEILVRIE
jgi:hypothetical protein